MPLGYSAEYPYGYSNGSQIKEQMLLVNTYEEFTNAVRENWKNLSAMNNIPGGIQYSAYATLSGGFWMGSEDSEPTVMINVRNSMKTNQIMNFYTIMASGVGISSSYYEFASTRIPDLFDLKAMIFTIYFGLIMSW